MIDVLIAVLFAASLHFLMGPAGLHSFGHAAYFGLGAYGAALFLQGSNCRWRPALLLGRCSPPSARSSSAGSACASRRLPGHADARLCADRLVGRLPVGQR
jgi:hypothetical protein